MYANKGDFDRAIADFTEASRLDPSNQSYRNNLQRARDEKAGKR
ncbi:hypothetical protein FACS1894200_10550 [Spirochaetia bacterium]|nr:hypothetical protein FACS1894200_10550 [Spirochaetia bacterium]